MRAFGIGLFQLLSLLPLASVIYSSVDTFYFPSVSLLSDAGENEDRSTLANDQHGPFALDNETILKTGTTIVGLVCRDGVVLGADTRSTGGPLVMDKNKLKIHTIAPRIFSCAAGTSADCDQITRAAGHQLALLRIERELAGEMRTLDPVPAALSSIVRSLHNHNNHRSPQSVLIVGGYDDKGPSLHMVDGDGVPQRVAFAALGSGSTDAIAMMESLREKHKEAQSKRRAVDAAQHAAVNETDTDASSSSTSSKPSTAAREGNLTKGKSLMQRNRFMEDIDVETAIDWVRQSVRAGILNDLGSGSHVDMCVIKLDEVRRWREQLQSSWDADRLPGISHRGLLQQQQQQQNQIQLQEQDRAHEQNGDNMDVAHTESIPPLIAKDTSGSNAHVTVQTPQLEPVSTSKLGVRVFTRAVREKYLRRRRRAQSVESVVNSADSGVSASSSQTSAGSARTTTATNDGDEEPVYETVERIVVPSQRYCDIEMLR